MSFNPGFGGPNSGTVVVPCPEARAKPECGGCRFTINTFSLFCPYKNTDDSLAKETPKVPISYDDENEES